MLNMDVRLSAIISASLLTVGPIACIPELESRHATDPALRFSLGSWMARA